MKPQVNVVEIGPRDGFQNVKEFIPTALKLEIIRNILKAGIRKVQITSFVSTRAIPQMQDAEEVAKTVIEEYPCAELFALVPNVYGAKSAVAVGLKEIAPVISLSASHNMANVKRTHEQSYAQIGQMRQLFPELKLTVDIATAFGCPFEGCMPVEQLLEMIGRLKSMGIHAFTLCDTIGIAYPSQVKHVMQEVKAAFPGSEFNIHIHDTRNLGVLNSYTAVLAGADSVQTALGGLGGCPFAPGATGNTATEDFIYLLQREGYETGVDFEVLMAAARMEFDRIDGNFSGHQIRISKNPCYVKQEA